MAIAISFATVSTATACATSQQQQQDFRRTTDETQAPAMRSFTVGVSRISEWETPKNEDVATLWPEKCECNLKMNVCSTAGTKINGNWQLSLNPCQRVLPCVLQNSRLGKNGSAQSTCAETW